MIGIKKRRHRPEAPQQIVIHHHGTGCNGRWRWVRTGLTRPNPQKYHQRVTAGQTRAGEAQRTHFAGGIVENCFVHLNGLSQPCFRYGTDPIVWQGIFFKSLFCSGGNLFLSADIAVSSGSRNRTIACSVGAFYRIPSRDQQHVFSFGIPAVWTYPVAWGAEVELCGVRAVCA